MLQLFCIDSSNQEKSHSVMISKLQVTDRTYAILRARDAGLG